jgi:exopolysaccharide biosynthesis protein
MKSIARGSQSPEPARRSSIRRRPSRRQWPLALVIALDVVCIGVGLVIFALFHHVIPRDVGMTGRVLPQATVGSSIRTSETTRSATVSSDPLTGLTYKPTTTIVGTSQTATGKTESTNSTSSTNKATTTASGTSTVGGFAEKFKSQFTTGGIEQTETTYKSPRVSVKLDKVQTGGVTYTIADIYVTDIRYLKTAFATGKYGRSLTDTVLDMAMINKAIVAMSGDYYGIRDKGVVIRNGVLYRETLYRDVLLMNNDGRMETFTAADFNINTVLKQGAWQSWSFGPMLLTDGKPMTTFNSDVTSLNPRSAIGYYEPGHYCFILVDGRQPGYSNGMTMKQLSQLFYDLGCKVAYNLDGGQSALLTFKDKIVNSPYNGGRNISDIVYIADQ